MKQIPNIRAIFGNPSSLTCNNAVKVVLVGKNKQELQPIEDVIKQNNIPIEICCFQNDDDIIMEHDGDMIDTSEPKLIIYIPARSASKAVTYMCDYGEILSAIDAFENRMLDKCGINIRQLFEESYDTFHSSYPDHFRTIMRKGRYDERLEGDPEGYSI